MYMEKTDKGEQKRTLYIQTLGTVRLTLGGRTISLHTSITGKAFQLFLLLAYTGTRGVTRTVLQDALYDRKTTDAANALRINASRLRKLLLRSELPEHNYIVVSYGAGIHRGFSGGCSFAGAALGEDPERNGDLCQERAAGKGM